MLRQVKRQLKTPDTYTLVLANGGQQAKHIMGSLRQLTGQLPDLKIIDRQSKLINCNQAGEPTSIVIVRTQQQVEELAGFNLTGLLFDHACKDENILRASRLVRSPIAGMKLIKEELEKL